MADFRIVPGFEDVWRPPVRVRLVRPQTVLRPASPAAVAERLARIVRRAPEVMVKVTGRTRDGAHLRAHLDYISRNGQLPLLDQDGTELDGAKAVRELAEDWAILADLDSRRRAGTPVSLSVVLSMPAETDPIRMRDAAADFARATFGDTFDHVLALHTDVGHPHVHLTVRALGNGGERLNPRKGDLASWRETFALALRDRGIEAEATPRRARGVVLKAERGPMRRIADRQRASGGPMSRMLRSAYVEAARGGRDEPGQRPWETAVRAQQSKLRGLYRAQAAVMARAVDPALRSLAEQLRSFVEQMAPARTRRERLVEDLRKAGIKRAPLGPGRSR